MNAKIEFTFTFTPVDNELPHFESQADAIFLLWQDSGLTIWLRELVAALPDSTPFAGPALIDPYPPPSNGDNDSEFLVRLTTVRLKHLFFGDPPAPWFNLSRVTLTRHRNTLICRYGA